MFVLLSIEINCWFDGPTHLGEFIQGVWKHVNRKMKLKRATCVFCFFSAPLLLLSKSPRPFHAESHTLRARSTSVQFDDNNAKESKTLNLFGSGTKQGLFVADARRCAHIASDRWTGRLMYACVTPWFMGSCVSRAESLNWILFL